MRPLEHLTEEQLHLLAKQMGEGPVQEKVRHELRARKATSATTQDGPETPEPITPPPAAIGGYSGTSAGTIRLDRLPVTVNRTYVMGSRGRGDRRLSERGREFRDYCHREARRQWGGPPLSGRLRVTVVYYLKGKRKRDLSNFSKILYDALNEVAWLDDEQIDEEHNYKVRDAPEFATTITVEEIG